MVATKTYENNVKIYYDSITKLRKFIDREISESNFVITACGFVDNAPFLSERKGLNASLAKMEHFCISLSNPKTKAFIYIALRYEMPSIERTLGYVKSALKKYKLAKIKMNNKIIINTVV